MSVTRGAWECRHGVDGRDWCDECHSERRSDSPGRRATDPTPDILALEKAAESLTRHGDIQNAIALWAIVLRLREEIKCPVT